MTGFKAYLAAVAALTLLDGASAGVARRWGTPAGPFCTDFTPFTYAGCFAEPASGLALPFKSEISTTNMTAELCVSFCKGNNYRYAGLEYYGECFCGASVGGVQVDDSQCNYPCTGNNTEACGGFSILSVYQDPTFPAVNPTSIADYQSSGCYTDSGPGRTLVYRQDALNTSSLTVNQCLQQCKKGGYALAGVEFASECYCGVVLGNNTQQVDISQCNMPCNGDKTQTCGGAALLNLYVANDLESSQPCNFGPVPSSSVSSPSSTKTSSTTSTSSTSTSTTATTTIHSTTAITTTATTTTTTHTTSTAALCTTTPSPVCEYSCGSWCSNPIPQFNSYSDCKVASSFCSIQQSACFSHATYPDTLKCFNFASWCQQVDSYCDNTCKWGQCSRDDCKSKNPCPNPPSLPSPSVYSCPPKTTITTATSSASSVPVPTPSNICVQPNNPPKGYSSNQPCGGIALPCLTCNNVKPEYDSGAKFKLYTAKDSFGCSSYTKASISQGCKDACLAQYNSCIGTYAASCKDNKNIGWWWSPQQDTYNSASTKCQNQYQDCLSVNSNVNVPESKCASWNMGW